MCEKDETWSPSKKVQSDRSQGFMKRNCYTKVGPLGKLHVINSIDNGCTKAEMARLLGVHPQTIAYIYKQKECLLKKYKAKMGLSIKNAEAINLNGILLDWMLGHSKNGNLVREIVLHDKALEVLGESFHDLEALDQWLSDFQDKNNIVEYIPDFDVTVEQKTWSKLIKDYAKTDVYYGGFFSLYHTLNMESFVKGAKSENYVSILFMCNMEGEKKKLFVVGAESHDVSTISLPLDYKESQKCVFNFGILFHHLYKWDLELESSQRKIVLAINIPDSFVERMNFKHIKILNTDNDFLNGTYEEITSCFRYYFRKHQIIHSYIYTNNNENITRHLDKISLAWHCVPTFYLRNLFDPPTDGGLFVNINDYDRFYKQNFSLSEWTKIVNLPIVKNSISVLDKFMHCDKDLTSLCKDVESMYVADDNEKNPNIPGSSGFDAYQAMKRLIIFLQSERATDDALESARRVEDHIEYNVMVELHVAAAENSTNEN